MGGFSRIPVAHSGPSSYGSTSWPPVESAGSPEASRRVADAVWTPGGDVVYLDRSSARYALRLATRELGGESLTLLESDEQVTPFSVSPSGTLLFTEGSVGFLINASTSRAHNRLRSGRRRVFSNGDVLARWPLGGLRAMESGGWHPGLRSLVSGPGCGTPGVGQRRLVATVGARRAHDLLQESERTDGGRRRGLGREPRARFAAPDRRRHHGELEYTPVWTTPRYAMARASSSSPREKKPEGSP